MISKARPAGPKPFTGWPKEALAFFDGLEEHNTREWFHEHKATYEQAVREILH